MFFENIFSDYLTKEEWSKFEIDQLQPVQNHSASILKETSVLELIGEELKTLKNQLSDEKKLQNQYQTEIETIQNETSKYYTKTEVDEMLANAKTLEENQKGTSGQKFLGTKTYFQLSIRKPNLGQNQ